MDNDWYYRWLLFSHYQHQGWQHKILSSSAQDMTPVSVEYVCGFCETIGANVKQSADTITRIQQALNLSKMPLSKPEFNDKIGLCDNCENKIKTLEEAATIRENLTELLLSNLKHLHSQAPESHPTLGAIPLNGHTPYHPLAQSLQKANEITPQQHSIKRKISSINWPSDSQPSKSRHLKRHVDRSSDQPVMSAAEPTHSDQENALTINEPSSSVSPHSSCGGFTPPPVSPAGSHQHCTSAQQVLTEVTGVRKRRKQARPAKAAGDVVPAVPEHFKLSVPTFQNTLPSAPHKSPSPAPQFPLSSSPHSVLSNGSRPPSTSRAASATNSEVDGHSSKASSVSPAPKLTPTQLVIAASFSGNTLPFNYSSFYQNNINNLLSSQASNPKMSAALLAQSFYNAASTNSLLNNPLLMGKGLMPAVSTPYQNSSNTKTEAKSNGHVTAKKEPKVPSFTFPTSSLQEGQEDGKPKAHKLVKTDKRRYCKVCAASMRKANNGRPPQSRFLCDACNMPMCRSCIEEHRYRVLMKCPDAKGVVKPSASAKLLQAVKMKDKANGDSKASPALSTKPGSSLLAAPPSHSSIIFGSPANTPTASSTVSTAHSNIPSQSIYASLLPNLPVQLASSPAVGSTPVDMRLPSYKPIAPAPPKEEISIKAERTTPVDMKDDDDEERLVIAESMSEAALSEAALSEAASEAHSDTVSKAASDHSLPADQTAITPEMASKTVAMLMPMGDESANCNAGVENLDNTIPDQSFQPIPQVSTNETNCASNESITSS